MTTTATLNPDHLEAIEHLGGRIETLGGNLRGWLFDLNRPGMTACVLFGEGESDGDPLAKRWSAGRHDGDGNEVDHFAALSLVQALDFVKLWKASRYYAVTLEYHATYHRTVGVEAPSIDEAIRIAYEDDGDGWKSYDDCGDTYVGHIGEHDSLDDAENAYGHQGEALPIPIKDRDVHEKLDALSLVSTEALGHLAQELEERKTSGNGEDFAALEGLVNQLRDTLRGIAQ